MSRYNGVYIASPGQGVTHTAADVLFELQPSGNVALEIVRIWISPDQDLTDAVQPIEFYVNDAAASGGTNYSSLEIQGDGDGSSAVTCKGGKPTQGATPLLLKRTAFHLLNGWEYLPLPEERIRFKAGGTNPYFGVKLATAPTSITLDYGVVWGELA